MADDRNAPRYCGNCGEISSGSETSCPDCGAEWHAASPENRVAAYALLLTDLAQLRAESRIPRSTYNELRATFEAKLIEARPPRAGTRRATETVAMPPPPAPEELAFERAPSRERPLPAEPVVTPRPARPAAAIAARNAPPSEPTDLIKPVREWAVRRQADLLLYLGAFMLSISALIFVDYQGGVISGLAKSALLAGYTAAFLVFGILLRRWERVQEAGPVFVAVGALLTPLNFLNLYANVLRDDGVPQEWLWLIGSASTCALYTLLALRGFGRLYLAPAAVAFGVAWGSLGATFGLPIEWFGPWFMMLAASVVVAAWRQYPKKMTWVEAAAAVIALPALALTHATAPLDDPDALARLALPVNYLILLAGMFAPAFLMRRRHVLAVLPPAGVMAIGSAFWAADAFAPEWIGALVALGPAGYLALGHFEPSVRRFGWWASVAAGALGLLLAHLAASASATNEWQMPATYGVLLATAAIEARWFRQAGLFVPPLGVAGGMAFLWAGGAGYEWWAYPALGMALVLAAASTVWRTEPAFAQAGWPMVLGFAFVPGAFSGVYADQPWHGAATFTLAATAFLVAALRTQGALAALFGRTSERAIRIEQQSIARFGGWALLVAAAYANAGFGLDHTESGWVFAGIGFVSWLAVVGLRGRVEGFEEVVAPVGLTAIVVGALAGLPSLLHVSVIAALGALGASLAAPRAGGYLHAWRAVAAAGIAGALVSLHSEPGLFPGETWEVPAVYALILGAVLFDAAYRRYAGAILAIPLAASAAIAAGIWYQEWNIAHYAWTPLAFAIALLWYSRREGHESVLGRPLAAYASFLSAAPVLFVGPYFDLPFAGTAAFAAAASIWGTLAAFRAKPLSWLFAAPDERSIEPSIWAVIGFALLVTATGYLAWGLELTHADGAWLVAGLGLAALALPAIRSRATHTWLAESLICGLAALALACLASDPREWQVAVFLGSGAAILGATAYIVRRFGLLNVVAGMLSGALLFVWLEAEWPAWSLALTYSAIGVAAYATFFRLRVPASKWRAVGNFVSVLFPVLGAVSAILAVNAKSDRLAGDALVKTTEWMVLAMTIAVVGALLVTDGVLRARRNATILGSAVLLGAVELAVASFKPGNVQAFTVPVALYLIGLGFYIRRSVPLFGRHMYTNEGVFVLASLVLVLPPAQQSFAPGGENWGLLVIAEALGLLGLGFAFAQRWLTVAGVITVAAAGGRFAFTSGVAELPTWVVIGLVGILLLALGVFLLFERDWWEKTRNRLAAWWLVDVPPEDSLPPPPTGAPLDTAP